MAAVRLPGDDPDEPTRGIDVGAKREIYEIINQLAAQGKAIIVVSSEMEEIMGISDRILVMHEGEISGEVKKRTSPRAPLLNTRLEEHKMGDKNAIKEKTSFGQKLNKFTDAMGCGWSCWFLHHPLGGDGQLPHLCQPHQRGAPDLRQRAGGAGRVLRHPGRRDRPVHQQYVRVCGCGAALLMRAGVNMWLASANHAWSSAPSSAA